MCLGHDPFEILQLTEATGWRAVYESDRGLRQVPLVCFALVKHKEEGFTFVSGMNPFWEDRSVVMPSDFVEEGNVLLGYLGPGESIDSFTYA